ncbi:type II toxin-antitoxin system YafQ family toxin [Streptococcus parauberis]|uniref:type II toxin-antitoxin system YafQ family toxin n=1 Tax=Streptococcus parauberis TaxID=1348 RepID=UPI0039B11E50
MNISTRLNEKILTYEFTNRYRKDLDKIVKRGLDVSIVNEAVKKIVNDEELGLEYKKHALEPKKQVPKLWEIYLGGRKSDLLMIYFYVENNTHVVFDRIGSH